MKLKNIIIAFFMITGLAVSGQNVSVNSLTVTPGAQSMLAVKLTGASDCIAAGFTLELPNGLFRVNGSEIDYAVTLDKNFTADHVAVPNLLNNKDLKVAIYSTANTPFAGGSTSDNSTLLKVNFRAYGMTSGTYQCKVKNIELVNSNHELQRLSNVSFTITVSASIGDVNGDGVVSGADVTALYNKLLSDIEPSGDADVNGDGVVNGADVTALYNSLLGN